MTTQNADANVTSTDTQNDAQTEQKILSPAMQKIGKSLDNLLASITSAANVGAPDTSAYTVKLAALEPFRDDPTFARAIADIEMARDAAISEHNRTARLALLADVRETYGAQFAALAALIAPSVPTVATAQRGRPTNASKSERTVARTADDIRANPAIDYIGAPLADIAACGHECALTSILTNGAKRAAHVKQQMTEMLMNSADPATHRSCVDVAKSIVPLYGLRLQLRDA